MTSKEILDDLLKELEAHPEQNIEDLLVAKAKEYNLSEDSLDILRDSFKIIDRISDQRHILANVRKEHGTRDTYISNSVAKLESTLPESKLMTIKNAIREVLTSLFKKQEERL